MNNFLYNKIIASVSKVRLKTSTGGVGTEIIINGGKLISVNDSDARRGTLFTVSDLFYNTPARLKYLKSLPQELASVTNIMTKFALANPNISFSLYNNNKELLKTSGNGDLVRLFGEIYGLDVAKELLIDEYKSLAFNLKLVLVKSTITRSN